MATGETGAGAATSEREGGVTVAGTGVVFTPPESGGGAITLGSAAPGNAAGRAPLDAHAVASVEATSRLKKETLTDTRSILTGYRQNTNVTPEVAFAS